MSKQIDKLIINSPYEEPKYYWHYDREHRSFEKREGRRPAGYVVATPDSKGFDDPGVFVPIELVNKIRPRVSEILKKAANKSSIWYFSVALWNAGKLKHHNLRMDADRLNLFAAKGTELEILMQSSAAICAP